MLLGVIMIMIMIMIVRLDMGVAIPVVDWICLSLCLGLRVLALYLSLLLCRVRVGDILSAGVYSRGNRVSLLRRRCCRRCRRRLVGAGKVVSTGLLCIV